MMRTAEHEVKAAAARRIQAAFRGWRTRVRVVWRVREQLSGFMAQMEREAEMERVLLGLTRPQQFQWLSDGDEGTRTALHLPRIRDDVFGIVSTFPDVLRMEIDEQALHAEAESHTPVQEQAVVANTGEEHDVAPCVIDDEATHEDDVHDEESSSVAASEAAQSQELRFDIPMSRASSDHGSELGTEANIENAVAGVDQQVEEDAPHPSREIELSSPSDMTVLPLTEPISPSVDPSLDVDVLLRTHSKDEILQEIEWAKQALRDRLEYLRRRHHRTCT